MSREYVLWEPEMEDTPPGEAEVVAKMVQILHTNNEHAYAKYKRGVRDAHAKTHAVLRGELEVHADLPEELAQ